MTNERTKMLNELITAFFLYQRDRVDEVEFANAGEGSIRSRIAADQQDAFERAIRCLEEVSCKREVIFRSLYRVNRAKVKAVQFPGRRAANLLATDFEDVASDLVKLQNALNSPVWDSSCAEMTRFRGAYEAEVASLNPEEVDRNENLSPIMEGAAESSTLDPSPESALGPNWHELLTMWLGITAQIDENQMFTGILGGTRLPSWLAVLLYASNEIDLLSNLPEVLLASETISYLQRSATLLRSCAVAQRKDILRSYARAGVYAYPIIACGEFQFELTANLLNAYDDNTDTAENVRKNLDNFRTEHPWCYRQLVTRITKEHADAHR